MVNIMLKKIAIALTVFSINCLPAHAQMFENFDSSFLGSGSVGFNQSGVSVNGGGSNGNYNASFGPGGLNSSFSSNGVNGNFNGSNLNVNGPGGINGNFNGSNGNFSGPGGINGTFNGNGVNVGANGSSSGGNYSVGTSSFSGSGSAGNQGSTGGWDNNSQTPDLLNQQMGPTFGIGPGGKTTKQLVGQGINGGTGVLKLPMCGTRGGSGPTLAPIFGY